MKIYLSQPISKGNANQNFYIGNEVHCRLMLAGYSVFNPGLSVANYGAQRELNWSQWIYTQDLPWVRVSDLVLRLPGASAGAEVELKEARHHKIPVVTPSFFECLDDLFELGAATLTEEDNDNLRKFLSRSRRALLLQEAALEGFARVK